MERLCFLIHLIKDTGAEYDQRHDDIWPEMEAAVAAAGFRNYSLFRLGELAVGYAECEPDVETVLKKWLLSMLSIGGMHPLYMSLRMLMVKTEA